jgi:hypothetical protein
MTIKGRIKRIILRDPGIAPKEIRKVLRHEGISVSLLLVSTVRFAFREDLRVLIEEGLIAPIDLHPSKQRQEWPIMMPVKIKRQRKPRFRDGEDIPRRKRFKPWHFPG